MNEALPPHEAQLDVAKGQGNSYEEADYDSADYLGAGDGDFDVGGGDVLIVGNAGDVGGAVEFGEALEGDGGGEGGDHG